MRPNPAILSTPRSTSLPVTPVRRGVFNLVHDLKYIKIRGEKINEIATELATDEFPLPEWRAPVFPDEKSQGVTSEDVINFLFLGNTINFQFRDYETGTKFAANYAGTEWSGAFGMWACLKREFDENPAILTGDTLTDLSREKVKQLFKSSNGIHIPMLEERYHILTQVGSRLNDRYDGEFANLVKAAEPYLFIEEEGIVDKLVNDFPSFRDSSVITLSNHQLLEVFFWKRAQLAPGMAYGHFQDSEQFELRDPAAFTVFVDYNLPNVLRGLDVLDYSNHLANLIDNRTILENGGREEVEIRAATVYAADRLIEQVNARRDSPVYAPHIDYKLFEMRDETSTPIHLTKTASY